MDSQTKKSTPPPNPPPKKDESLSVSPSGRNTELEQSSEVPPKEGLRDGMVNIQEQIITISRKRLQVAESQLDDHRKETELQEELLDMLEQKLSYFDRTVEQYASKLNGQNARVVQLETQNDELKKRVDKQDEQVNDLKTQLHEIKQKDLRLHPTKKSSDETETKIIDRSQPSKSLCEQTGELENRSNNTSQSLRDYKEKHRAIESDLSMEKEKSQLLNEQLSQSNGRNKALEEELSAERNTTRDLTKHISQMTEDSQLKHWTMSEEIAQKDQTIKDFSQYLETQKSRTEELKAELVRNSAANETLKKELEGLQKEKEESMRARELQESQKSLSQNQKDERSRREIDALDSQRKEKDRRIVDLEGRLQESTEAQNKYKKTIEKLHGEAHDAKRELQEQRQKMDELKTRQAELESNLEQQKTKIKRLSMTQHQSNSERVQLLEKENTEKNTEISGLQGKLTLLEKKLMDVQEFAFILKKIAVQGKTDDGDIRNRLEYEFRDGTRLWAKEWAANTFNSSFDTSNLTDLRLEIQKVAQIQTEASLQLQLQKIHPRLMVDALLSRYLVDQIFLTLLQRSAGQNEDDGLSIESALSKILTEFYKIFIRVDESQAYSWRSETLALFQTSNLTVEDGTKVAQFMNDLNKLAENFLTGPARLFLKPVPESVQLKRTQQLIQLMKETVDLSMYIQRQCTVPEIRGFDFYRHHHFRHDSPEMEADRSHHMDPDDPRRDGESIRMVIKPGFCVTGKENRQPKIWAKAVVLLP